MANLLELMTPKQVIAYIENRNNVQRIGDALFPNRKTDALEIQYLKGAGGLPVAASLHSWDSETEIGSRFGAETWAQELALIKRKLPIREREIIAINSPRNDAELRTLINNRFNDVDTLVDGVLTRVEAMKMEALAYGKIDISENGIVGVVDYGLSPSQNITLTDTTFDTPDVDILGQLQSWVDLMADKGVTISRAITSNKILRLIAADPTIRSAVYGVNSAMLLTTSALNSFLQTQGLPTFITYDEKYRVQKGDGTYDTKRYFPEDRIVFMPSENLGEGMFGPTAEEIDLMGDPSIDITRVSNVLAMVYKTADPVTHWTKAVASFMPSFPGIDSIVSVKVI